MLPTKSNVFCQKILMIGTDMLLLKWNHYLQMCHLSELSMFIIINYSTIATELKTRILKKLIKDNSSKTIFSANSKFYKQIDDVSMGSFLGPLLANIFITEMDKTIIKNFIDDKILLFYGRYIDDTLVIIKRELLNLVHDALNNFGKNLNFTVDTLDNVFPHFLGIEIHPDGLSIYKYRYRGKTLVVKVIPHGATNHLRFLPLYTELSIFVIKINFKENSQE